MMRGPRAASACRSTSAFQTFINVVQMALTAPGISRSCSSSANLYLFGNLTSDVGSLFWASKSKEFLQRLRPFLLRADFFCDYEGRALRGNGASELNVS